MATTRDAGEREEARLAALDRLDAVRYEADEVLQGLVDDAREAFATDLCLVNLVLSRSLFFRAWSGELPEDLAQARRGPREQMACRHVVQAEAPLVVEDFMASGGLEDEPVYVVYGVRFYAGVPLITSDGHAVGSLCLLNAEPAEFGEKDLALLGAFGRAVVGRLETLGALGRERTAKEEEVRRGRELERLARQQERILGSAGEGILGLDSSGKIEFANPAAAAMLGYEPGEMVGENMHDLVHHTRPDGTPYPKEECPNYLALGTGRKHRSDGEVYWRKDETGFPVEYASSPVVEGGEVVGAVVTFSDATARKEAEEALKKSETGLAEAQRMARLGSWEWDVRTGEVSWSDEVFRIYGHAPASFVPSLDRLMQAVHPEDRDLVRRKMDGALRGRESYDFEHRVVRPDGEVRVVHRRAEVSFDEGGRPLRMIGTVHDVTERKRAEEALKESERRFGQLFDQSVDALLVHDEAGRMVDCNAEACRSLGYTREELLSLRVEDFATGLLRDDEKGDTEGGTLWQRAVAGGQGAEGVHHGEHRRKDGTTFPVEVRVGGVDYGSRRMVLASARDVTDRERAEKALKRSEEQYRRLVETVQEGIGFVDADEKITYCNLAYARIFGLSPEELVGRSLLEFLDEEGIRVVAEQTARRRENERTEYELPVIAAGGERRILFASGAPIMDEDGSFRGAVHAIVDVTERTRAEEALKRSEERFRSLVQNASDLITVMGADGTIRYESPSVERMLGYAPEDLVGTNAFSRVHPDDAPRVLRAFSRLSEEGGANPYVEYRFLHADGSWRHLESSSADLLDEPSVGGIVVNSRDVTERKLLEERVLHQALHDPLTGLPNRTLLLDRLTHALERADRREGSCVAVLFLDLDDFKVVNDSLGHEAGDRLLVEAAERLGSCLRPEDTLARLGGDEFVVLLVDVSGRGEATGVAGRIAEALRGPFSVGGQEEVFVSASVGVALGTVGDGTQGLPENLLRRADMAMYEAKRKGKAHNEVFDPRMDSLALKRLRTGTALRRAVERGEFRVFYQPEVELSSGRIVGFEALVRWEHPEQGLVSPARFIPVAEETGLIVPIGQWVLTEACRQAKEWREDRPEGAPCVMSVNLSARQFGHPDLARDVARALRETGAEPSSLVLEITESVVMEDARSTIRTLEELKALGVGLAIDDFGTGYSSLSYLRRFPVDHLKVDRSFVDGLGEDPGDWVLVSGIVDLAHALGLEVVAEGVETAEQLGLLRNMGCDLAQGDHFARPLPGQEASALLFKDLP